MARKSVWLLVGLFVLTSLASALTPSNWQQFRFTPTNFGVSVKTAGWNHELWPKASDEKITVVSAGVLGATVVSICAVQFLVKDPHQQEKWMTYVGGVGILGWALYWVGGAVAYAMK